MSFITSNKSRQHLANGLVIACVAAVLFFWGYELKRALDAHDNRAEEIVLTHRDFEFEHKSRELRELFNELYSNSRTISLLPMIRAVEGGNRASANEDVVAAGRLSLDAHHTMQQVYTNLQTRLRVSEIYYVLDGFNPTRGDVPFFMYDDKIVGRASQDALHPKNTLAPAEVEDFEYDYFPKQLEWFRQQAPQHVYSDQLENIPVRLSPMMRTCDNSQFLSEQHGSPRDVEGLIYAMPVYALSTGKFKGMITSIIRRNMLEAKLLGVPFLPVTLLDQERMKKEGWALPAEHSPFLLRNLEYGIDVFDRRQTLFGLNIEQGLASKEGRWYSMKIDFHTGSPWELHYFMSNAEIDELTEGVRAAKRETLFGRIFLLALLLMTMAWVAWLIRRGRRELMWLAQYDSLTELPNRRAFFERLSAVIVRAHRNKGRAGLFFVDIAGFNSINDALGQQAGDQLLAQVGQRLLDSVRGSDLVTRSLMKVRAPDSVARLGGDEFTVLTEDLKSSDDLAVIAERIMTAMKVPIVINGNEIEVSLYIGIAAFPEDASDGEALLMSAESAMQLCRKSGPGFLLYNEEIRKRAARQHQLEVELALALDCRQFELFYQPKVSLADGCVASFEALLRWRHPVLGLISPIEFIPILERTGRIVEVGEWVLFQSCRDLMALRDLGYADIRVSANVSVRQLRRGNFHETVARALAETGIDSDLLVLEITESLVMENLEEGKLALERIAAQGVRLAIDDFGTGFSSLTYLQYLPLNYLKLDKSFIDGMTNERARHIVHSVILLAQGLNLHTIAEGIETETQREALRALGCDIIQGYLLSKPKPFAEIIEWLKKYQAEQA